jgi:hypothetical protein
VHFFNSIIILYKEDAAARTKASQAPPRIKPRAPNIIPAIAIPFPSLFPVNPMIPKMIANNPNNTPVIPNQNVRKPSKPNTRERAPQILPFPVAFFAFSNLSIFFVALGEIVSLDS